jgi:hypothetical protein
LFDSQFFIEASLSKACFAIDLKLSILHRRSLRELLSRAMEAKRVKFYPHLQVNSAFSPTLRSLGIRGAWATFVGSPEMTLCRTACEWQSFVSQYSCLILSYYCSHCYHLADHTAMTTKFRAAMSKLATLGQIRDLLYDCSGNHPPAPPVEFSRHCNQT